MKKRSRFCRLSIVLLSLLLSLSLLTSCGLSGLFLLFVPLSASTDFYSLEYERPDFDTIKAGLENVLSHLEAGKSAREVENALYTPYSQYFEAYSQYNLLQIHYSFDTRVESVSDEIEYCSERLAELDLLLNRVYLAIVDADMADTILSAWSDEDLAALEVERKLYEENENDPLSYTAFVSRRTALENEYTELSASLEISYHGAVYTIDQAMEAYMEGRLTQEDYRSIVLDYYRLLNESGGEIYLDLLELDRTMYAKLDMSCAEYYYAYYYGHDYSPEEGKRLHNYVKTYVVPLYEMLSQSIDSDLVVEALYKINNPLIEYSSIIERYTEEISVSMADAYDRLRDNNLVYWGNEEGMQMASYTTYLPAYDIPFIYLYTYGDLDDVTSFIHEFGHFFSYSYNGLESDGVMDISEIQSQANEWLFAPYYDLSEEELTQYLAYRLSETLSAIIEGALFDEFQQTVYSHSYTTVDELNACFVSLAAEYQMQNVYDSEILPYVWTAVHHNFIAPFYYISYAVSAIPSLQIYERSLSDRSEAIETYLDICDETGYRSFSDVLEDNDLFSPFETNAYVSLNEFVLGLLSESQTAS